MPPRGGSVLFKIMIRIGLKSDIKKLTASLSVFNPDQLPFTVATALNRTAEQARDAVVAAMPAEFILRREFIKTGVLVDYAKKTNLTAIVYDRDKFMARQESGADKIPMDGGQNLAVPLAARPNVHDIIPEELLPANLGKAEYTTSRNGRQITKKGSGNAAFKMISNGKTYLAMRTAAGLQMMYLLIPVAKITPRLRLADITMQIVKANFAGNFIEAARVAMATRREGGRLTDT